MIETRIGDNVILRTLEQEVQITLTGDAAEQLTAILGGLESDSLYDLFDQLDDAFPRHGKRYTLNYEGRPPKLVEVEK